METWREIVAEMRRQAGAMHDLACDNDTPIDNCCWMTKRSKFLFSMANRIEAACTHVGELCAKEIIGRLDSLEAENAKLRRALEPVMKCNLCAKLHTEKNGDELMCIGNSEYAVEKAQEIMKEGAEWRTVSITKTACASCLKVRRAICQRIAWATRKEVRNEEVLRQLPEIRARREDGRGRRGHGMVLGNLRLPDEGKQRVPPGRDVQGKEGGIEMNNKSLTYGDHFKDEPLHMVLSYHSIWCTFRGENIELSDWLEMTYEEIFQ